MDKDKEVRLSKLMSQRNICSRREADRFIESGMVIVDGKVVDTLGIKVLPECNIELIEQAQNTLSEKFTVALHKPLGYLSTHAENNYKAAYSLLTKDNFYGTWDEDKQKSFENLQNIQAKNLSTAGRLDINSKGLLLFTNDGVLVKKIIGPESNTEKEYLIRVKQNVGDQQLDRLRYGLSVHGEKLKQATVELIDVDYFKIILTQGKKRQIRKMCLTVNLDIMSLKRVRVSNVKLKELPLGKWRFLTEAESSNI